MGNMILGFITITLAIMGISQWGYMYYGIIPMMAMMGIGSIVIMKRELKYRKNNKVNLKKERI